MNRPTKPNEILAMPATEHNHYAAEMCMGWRLNKTIGCLYDSKGRFVFDYAEYQPSQPTEKGKAQCFDLIFKFNLTVDVENESVMGPGAAGDCVSIHGKVTQAKIVTAAILCALAEKE